MHYNNPTIGGALRYAVDIPKNYMYLTFTESICVVAVNVFVAISAWFLCENNNRKLSKVIYLLLQVSIINEIHYFINIFLKIEIFSFKNVFLHLLPINWYVILYIALYLISPYINNSINGLGRRDFTRLIFLSFILFSCWPFFVDWLSVKNNYSFFGLSTIGAYGSQAGYTFTNFCLIYILVAYYKIYRKSIPIIYRLIASVFNIFIVFIHSIYEISIGRGEIISRNYNNPILIIQAILILDIFIEIKHKSVFINYLAKASFLCYLIHGMLFPLFNIRNDCLQPVYLLALKQIFTVIGIYLISTFAYYITKLLNISGNYLKKKMMYCL